MVSEEEMRKIMKGVRAIGRNNAGVNEAAHLLAEAMKEGVVWKRDCRVTHLNSVRGYNAKGTELTDESGDTIFAVILGDWLAEEGARLRLTARVEGGSG